MDTQEKDLLCMSCMHPVPAGSRSCPECGYDGTQHNPAGLLAIGTRLQRESFIVGRVLTIGSSAVEYAGYHVEKGTPCLVREYYPAGVCRREKDGARVYCLQEDGPLFRSGLDAFTASASRYTVEEGDTALPVRYGLFAENGTAYLVCEDFRGMTLEELMRRGGGHLTWQQTMAVLRPVFRALRTLHEGGLVYGVLSPETILLDRRGAVRLRNALETGCPDPAYAAPETTVPGTDGPEVDLYSLGAVLYRCLTGAVPADAAVRRETETLCRPAEIDPDIPAQLSETVWMALRLDPVARMKSIAEMEALLGEEYLTADPSVARETPRKKHLLRTLLLVAGAAALLALAVWWIVRSLMSP